MERPDGFDQSVLSEMDSLRAFARKLTGVHDRADDLVSETAIKAMSNSHLFTPGTSMRNWLFTILRNCLYSGFRKTRREVEDVDGSFSSNLSIGASQEDSLILKDVLRRIKTMPPEMRRALMLIASGISYDDAAVMEGVAPGTMKSRVFRARSFLEGCEVPMLEDSDDLDAISVTNMDDRILNMLKSGASASEIIRGVEGATIHDVMRLRPARGKRAR